MDTFLCHVLGDMSPCCFLGTFLSDPVLSLNLASQFTQVLTKHEAHPQRPVQALFSNILASSIVSKDVSGDSGCPIWAAGSKQ